MLSIQEMKNLENFLFEDDIGCVFKKVYSDGSERIFIEYSGYTVLESCISDKGDFYCDWLSSPPNWESEIREIEKKVNLFRNKSKGSNLPIVT